VTQTEIEAAERRPPATRTVVCPGGSKTRIPTDPGKLVWQARRFGRLREVTPRQAAIVRAAAVYDQDVLPEWQRPGKGVNSELEAGAYTRGVTWVRTKKLCHGARGAGWRMTRKRVELGQPHLAWLSREHWLAVVANAAIEERPDLLRNRPNEGTWSVSRAMFMFYLEVISLYADRLSGRDVIVRPDKLGQLMEVSEDTAKRCQRVAEALGLLVVLEPGRMLYEPELRECRQGGSKQRGLANHSALVVPRWLNDADAWAARPETPQTVSQAVHGAPSASETPSEDLDEHSTAVALAGDADSDTSASAGLPAEPVDNSAGAALDREGCATPTRGPVRVRSTRTHLGSLGSAHCEQRGFAAGEKAPPPAALAPTEGVGSSGSGRVEPGLQTPPGRTEAPAAARTAPRTAPRSTRLPENRSTGRSAPPSGEDRARRGSGRRYEPAAMDLAYALTGGALAPLRGIQPGRIETALRRFVGCREPWTADDVVEAFDQHNARLGRARMTREDCRYPLAWFAAMLRELDVDADHPRAQAAFPTTSTSAGDLALEPCSRPDCDGHGWNELEVDGRTVLTQCPDCPPEIRRGQDVGGAAEFDEHGAPPF
jgi:hypothetical protein